MMIALLRQDLAIAMEAERVTDVVYVVIDDVGRAWCLLWYRDTTDHAHTLALAASDSELDANWYPVTIDT